MAYHLAPGRHFLLPHAAPRSDSHHDRRSSHRAWQRRDEEDQPSSCDGRACLGRRHRQLATHVRRSIHHAPRAWQRPSRWSAPSTSEEGGGVSLRTIKRRWEPLLCARATPHGPSQEPLRHCKVRTQSHGELATEPSSGEPD
ncbi:hypothetical protein CDD83_8547 [Cordyceps sp. RAO-2017]|nr:hypothetical protein CDD83_8547 [Cordyceps sp. RAO-2017]